MPKTIIILLDGTSNEIDANRSNILRLYGCLKKSEQQLVYYDPGVGTFGSENVWLRFWRKATEVWGMATGWGLDKNVKEAYQFLVENCDYCETKGDTPGWQDQIYIFGFSRGAYSARVLAGFLHNFGLMEKRNLNLLKYTYRAYKRIGLNKRNEQAEKDKSFAEIGLYERTLQPYRPSIRFLGLFDTVASVIEHGRYGLRLRTSASTNNNRSVESVRHAVSIHERRTMFRPHLWPEGQEYRPNRFNKKSAKSQDAREVWFTGVHADIGGGYAEPESALAKLSLDWMIKEARVQGVDVSTRTVNTIVLGKNQTKRKYTAPDPFADKHISMGFLWSLIEFIPRLKPQGSHRPSFLGFIIPLFERRNVPENARIHASVLKRAETKGDKPNNLPVNFIIED